MEQYIKKFDVVAEIERRIKECDKLADTAADNNLSNTLQANELLIRQYTSLLHFLDIIEPKEVDLDYIKKELDEVVRIYKPNGNFGWGTLYNVATHFFELGLKTQKGE